ncbi:alpha/beta hydrolase [Actinokineospora sp. PR83]|uniref:alpha/beta fold hydrolase n=1 Tax=Actinokineospora sp. PR83 TaxID=2884908 RepID=UPI001F2079C8|nr:alpha/beta hydrolase [Actinokineospora sp. PR83]MCG8917806.1 alpha/beta hydrolase [Actinokineospora sp. PR83]
MGPFWVLSGEVAVASGTLGAVEIVEFGGTGRPIVVLHALMGRASTWWPCAAWLTRYGRVLGFDARSHGRNPHRGVWTTEDFVGDLVDVLTGLGEPAVLIGHSMGGLHALGAAASAPTLVRGVVTEDVGVDLVGRTADDWRALFAEWPVPFPSLAHVRGFFGPAADYFAECVEERDGGYRLIADLDDLFGIAEEWGRRDFWAYVDAVSCPVLAIEAEHSVMPAGQQELIPLRAPGGGRHVVAPGAGHLVHGSAPEFYRGAVEAFLSELLGR